MQAKQEGTSREIWKKSSREGGKNVRKMQQLTRQECMQESSKVQRKKVRTYISKRTEKIVQEGARKKIYKQLCKKVGNKSSKELGKK